ncbi:MAG: flippase-like domain-containing protein [Thermoflexales bacterium]|nr:flippase-like domain-containing protein [Thermoflexales bacterium]
MKQRWLFWIGLGVSALFLYLALRGAHLSEVRAALAQAQAGWVALGMVVYFVSVALRAQRWSVLLAPVARLRAAQLYPIVVIGYMGNNIYPARIGELLRAYVLQRSHGAPIASSLATVLIERVLDSAVLIGFVLTGLPIAHALSASVRSGVLALGAVLLGAVSALIVLGGYAHALSERIERWLVRWLPARWGRLLAAWAHRFLLGAQSLSRPRALAATVFLTLGIWLLETVKYWCVAQAFNIHVPFTGLMLVNGLSNLFTIIPGAPGGVGTFDAGGVLGMVSLGVPHSLAVAYVLVLHAALWFPVTALGLALMVREGLRWADLARAEQLSTEQQAAT